MNKKENKHPSYKTKRGETGSIKNLLDTTPELQIKYTNYSNKITNGMNFLSPEWQQATPTNKNKRASVDLDKLNNKSTDYHTYIPDTKRTKSTRYIFIYYIVSQLGQQKQLLL